MTEATLSPPTQLTTIRMTQTGQNEDRLVARARGGDQDAFNQLAERYSTRLRRALHRITRDCDAAYDAVQEALMRAWQNIGRFEGRSRFYTWLTRIGINEAYRGLRRRTDGPLEIDDPDLVGERVPDWGSSPERVFESREFLGAVDSALAELPLDYRTAVTLRDVEGLSTTEAAEILGIGERALKSRLHRGRMALRAKLDHYFAERYV
ncbi:MAG TPA: sigma-70 family RNA polymerase sigma factor [Solirubrobacterales bacterium]|nr:sigma-70 family RNA polymerase sigma factor [Solirubrobacterales bacterium]